MKILKKIDQLIDKNNINKKELKQFSIFLFLTIVVFFFESYYGLFSKYITPVFFVIFLIIMFITWLMAGLAVIKSLFVVSASLSLLIFLAQSYCALPTNEHTANSSLESLIWFGLIYIVYLFLKSLYGDVIDNKKSKMNLSIFKEINKGKYPWMPLTLYAIFMGIFLWQLYQVVDPIISNFCIYK